MSDDNAMRIWRICQNCAKTVYASKPPTPEYADAVAQLLFGTAAQESNLIWERQRSPRWEGDVGGFSKWQLEKASIKASLDALKKNAVLAKTAGDFLFADPNAPDSLKAETSVLWATDIVLWSMRMDDNDHIGALFCRLHYLRCPGAVPTELQGQAEYWKKYYNTSAGKGTAAEYIENWKRYCDSVAEVG